MKPKGKPDRIIVSREEAEREVVARKLQSQGEAAFGDPNERFDVGSDKHAMDSVGMKLKEPDAEELARRRDLELEAIASQGFGGGVPTGASPWGENKSSPPVEQKGIYTMGSKPVKQEEPKEEVKEEVKEPEAPAQPQMPEDPIERMHHIATIMKEIHPNFPSGDQLIQWKQMMGDVFILDLGDRVFIYRYLKRQEWVQMNANEAYHGMRQDQKEDMIYNKCVVWPTLGPQQVAGLPAGCVSSVVGQIEQQSMFLDPRELANFTIKL